MSPLSAIDSEALLQTIPTPSPGVIKVIELIDSGANESSIEAAVIQDPSLTAQVLRIANSPFFGTSREVESIAVACRLLGLAALRNIVITSSLIKVMPATTSGIFDPTAFWFHAQAAATAARLLLRRVSADADLAFLGGLLHDIGRLVLIAAFPDKFSAAVSESARTGIRLEKAEAAILGIDHAEVGGQLFERWHFPASLVNLVRYHHRPGQIEPLPAELAAVHIADGIAHLLGNSPINAPLPAVQFSPAALAALDLAAPLPKELLTEIREALRNTPALIMPAG